MTETATENKNTTKKKPTNMSSSSSAKAAYVFRDALVEVASDRVSYSDDAITSEFTYESTVVEQLPGGKLRATPTAQTFSFKTQRKVPKLGVVQMLEAELELAAGGRGGARLGEQRKHAGGWATNTDGSC